MKHRQAFTRWVRLLLLVVLSLPMYASILAQGDDVCPTIVMTAVQNTEESCSGTGRNQVCYGHILAEAVLLDGGTDLAFTQEGDIRDVADLRTIRTAPLDEANDHWGIAIMRIQANLPGTLPGQNVTIVLFGDAAVSSEENETPSPTIPVTVASTVNLRQGPSTSHAVVGTLVNGGAALADGRLADGSWLHIRLSENDVETAWVYAPLVTAEGDTSELRVIEANAPLYGPMQAFAFRTGLLDAPCMRAPESGILIQTPRAVGEVTLEINGLEIALGSTALLQGGTQSGKIEISQLEGTGRLPGYDNTLLDGQIWEFELPGDVWMPAGEPRPLDSGRVLYLPLDLLPRPITIHERQVIQSGSYQIVTRYFPPAPDAPASGNAAVLVHGRGLDWTSWGWLIPSLQSRGWGVLAADMPGHGETGGEPNYSDWAGIIGDITAYAQTRGFTSGAIFGSSIGANSGLVACAAGPDWCLGTALFSPGIDYFGVETLPAMGLLGSRPALIITSEYDSRGGPGNIAREIARAGANVTLQIYDGDLHGTFLAEQYDLLEPLGIWMASITPTR
jgi:uncharacterized protein YraI